MNGERMDNDFRVRTVARTGRTQKGKARTTEQGLVGNLTSQ